VRPPRLGRTAGHAVEEIGDGAAPLVASLVEERAASGRRQAGAEREGRVQEAAPVRVEQQDAAPPLHVGDPLAERVKAREVGGVEALGLSERLQRREGGLDLLVDGPRHRERRFAHAALGDRELQPRIVTDDERGEAQDGHQRRQDERDEVTSKSHGPPIRLR
jgi:hypothetical protein